MIPLSVLLLLLVRRRWVSAGFLLAATLGGNMLVVQGLKHLVDRPRPAHPLVRVDHGSFPSGHAATAALLVVLLGVLLVPVARRRAWWIGGAVFILAMMWSRTWLHAHWLSDTAAGAAAGAGVGLVAWWLFGPALARERARAHDRRGRPRARVPPEPSTRGRPGLVSGAGRRVRRAASLIRDVDAGGSQVRFDQGVQPGDGRRPVLAVVVDRSVPGGGVGPAPGRHRQERPVAQ